MFLHKFTSKSLRLFVSVEIRNRVNKFTITTEKTERELPHQIPHKNKSFDQNATKQLHNILNPRERFDQTKFLISMRKLDALDNDKKPAKTNAYNQFFRLVIENLDSLDTDLRTLLVKYVGQMRKNGALFNYLTYSLFTTGFTKLRDIDSLRKIEYMAKEDDLLPINLANQLILGYSLCKEYDTALVFYEQFSALGLKPDVVTYNTLIVGATLAGEVKQLWWQLFNVKYSDLPKWWKKIKVLENPPPVTSFTKMATSYLAAGNMEGMIKILQDYIRAKHLSKEFLRILTYQLKKSSLLSSTARRDAEQLNSQLIMQKDQEITSLQNNFYFEKLEGILGVKLLNSSK